MKHVVPIKNKVGGEKHEEAPLVALAGVTEAGDFPCHAAQAGSGNQHLHLRDVTVKQILRLVSYYFPHKLPR